MLVESRLGLRLILRLLVSYTHIYHLARLLIYYLIQGADSRVLFHIAVFLLILLYLLSQLDVLLEIAALFCLLSLLDQSIDCLFEFLESWVLIYEVLWLLVFFI